MVKLTSLDYLSFYKAGPKLHLSAPGGNSGQLGTAGFFCY